MQYLNNTKKIFFLCFLMCAYLVCEEKKIANKVIDNQKDSIKITTKKDTIPIMYNRDSLFYSLQNEKNIDDNSFMDYGIGSVIGFNFDNDKLVFVHFDNNCYTQGNMKQDLYILSFQNSKWNIIDSMKLAYEVCWIDTIKLVDIDFDNKKEILVRYHLMASRSIIPYEFFSYNAKTHQIKHYQSFISSLDEIVNTKNKTIILGSDSGIYQQQKSIYRWNADTLQTIREINMNSDYNSNKITITIAEFEDGNYKKSKEKVFHNNDKAWEYFEKWQ